MKAVILAGGLGTRISEETAVRPKPMIEIGGRPVLWHILKIYSHYGINDFIICLGYKGYLIKEYFANYFLHMSDVTLRSMMTWCEPSQHGETKRVPNGNFHRLLGAGNWPTSTVPSEAEPRDWRA